jgi:hypothetical protein
MAVAAVIGDQPVGGAGCVNHADGAGLLANAEMRGAAQDPFSEQVAKGFFKGADEHHAPIHIKEVWHDSGWGDYRVGGLAMSLSIFK